MRPGLIIAIIVAAIIVIGGFVWYNNDQAERVRLDQQRAEQNAQSTRDAEDAAAQQSAMEANEPPGTASPDDAPAADDGIVVGDEITEDTTVVPSETDGANILDPDAAAAPAGSAGDTQTPGAAGDVETTTGAGTTATTTAPEELLTPENFDRDEVLALIDGSDGLSDDERSTLRALAEGASANPDMVEPAITSIRDALDMPPLN